VTPTELERRRAAPEWRRSGPAVVDRRSVDDSQAWDDLVQLLADLLYPSNPDEPRRP